MYRKDAGLEIDDKVPGSDYCLAIARGTARRDGSGHLVRDSNWTH
jgi:hypothetical protein